MKFNNYLTQNELKDILEYNQDTGIFIWKKQLAPRGKIGTQAGCIDNRQGRIVIRINGHLYFAHRLAWLYVYGEWPEFEIDHENLNPSDNRILNLRKATSAQNKWNKKAHKNSKSGIRGVSYNRRDKRWIATIYLNKKVINRSFLTKQEAIEERKNSAIKHHGEFARVA